MTNDPANVTEILVEFADGLTWDDLPENVRRHSLLGVVNILGCMLGGSTVRDVTRVDEVLARFSGPEIVPLIGTGRRRDPLSAGLLNAASASARTYDDTHAEAVVHASASVAAALVSTAYLAQLSGRDFLLAYVLGVEIACRLSLAISVPPGESFVGWSQTGICSTVAATFAAVKALGGNKEALHAALTAASGQAAGLRVAQGTFASSLTYGNSTQVALRAALLGCSGLKGHTNSLEAPYGFLAAFSRNWSTEALTAALGHRYEILRNLYKPYPCGVVIHSIIDGCLALSREHGLDSEGISSVRMRVNKMVLALTDRRHPKTQLSAQVSCYHWAAVSLHLGKADLSSVSQALIDDAEIYRLRDLITLEVDDAIPPEAVVVGVTMRDGTELVQTIREATGSAANPMTAQQIAEKFLAQAEIVMEPARAAALHEELRNLCSTDDMRFVFDKCSDGLRALPQSAS